MPLDYAQFVQYVLNIQESQAENEDFSSLMDGPEQTIQRGDASRREHRERMDISSSPRPLRLCEIRSSQSYSTEIDPFLFPTIKAPER